MSQLQALHNGARGIRLLAAPAVRAVGDEHLPNRQQSLLGAMQDVLVKARPTLICPPLVMREAVS